MVRRTRNDQVGVTEEKRTAPPSRKRPRPPGWRGIAGLRALFTLSGFMCSLCSHRMAQEGRRRGAGGTRGGLGEFFGGCAMALVGFYLLVDQIHVSSSFWRIGGHDTVGVTLFAFVIGVGFLFHNGESKVGWFMTVGALLAIISGVLFHLRVYFTPTSMWNTLGMLVLLGGGLGLVARAVREH